MSARKAQRQIKLGSYKATLSHVEIFLHSLRKKSRTSEFHFCFYMRHIRAYHVHLHPEKAHTATPVDSFYYLRYIRTAAYDKHSDLFILKPVTHLIKRMVVHKVPNCCLNRIDKLELYIAEFDRIKHSTRYLR